MLRHRHGQPLRHPVRGRTIFPGDLLTLRTAANVAGNYDYRLDATQLQCLLVLALLPAGAVELPRQQGRSLPRLWITPRRGCGGGLPGGFFGTGFLSALEIEPSMWTTAGNGFLLNFSVFCATPGCRSRRATPRRPLTA